MTGITVDVAEAASTTIIKQAKLRAVFGGSPRKADAILPIPRLGRFLPR